MPHVVGSSSTYSKTIGQGLAGYPQFATGGHGAVVYVDGNQFIDWTCSLGATFLGHGHPQVNNAILEQLNKGIAFSLPTTLEEKTAKRFCSLTGWEQVRFCKNGSDATEAAVRLARHHTKRRVILCTGYHGSHSDLVSATEGKSGGVLEDCQDYVWRCPSEESLLNDLQFTNIAAVITEPYVMGSGYWNWQKVKEVCDASGTLLIFDEIITGFRSRVGSPVDVRPHLACYGKAIANGMPLALVAGSQQLMQGFERDVFMSGTAAGELLSLASCDATLSILSNADYDTLNSNGEEIGKALAGIAQGYPMRWQLTLSDVAHRIFISELAKKGILVGRDIFLTLAHTLSHVDMLLTAIYGVRTEYGI